MTRRCGIRLPQYKHLSPTPEPKSIRRTLDSASTHHGCPTPTRLATLARREGQIQHKPPPLRRLDSHRGQREAATTRKMPHRTRAERSLQDRAGHDQLERPQARGAYSVRL